MLQENIPWSSLDSLCETEAARTARGFHMCRRANERTYSVSEIERYLRCPLSYYFRYVVREEGESNAFVAVSASLREAALHWYRARSTCELVGSAGDVVDLFRSLVEVRGYRARGAELAKAAEPALISYVMQANSRQKPVAEGSASAKSAEIAKQVTVRFKNRRWRLTGEVPLILEDGTVVDLRVCMNGKTASDLAKDFRLSAYAFFSIADEDVCEDIAGPSPEVPVRLDVFVVGRQPKAQCLRDTRRTNDVARFVRLVELAVDGISKCAFPPTHPNNWNCSARWCAYYGVCMRGTPPAPDDLPSPSPAPVAGVAN